MSLALAAIFVRNSSVGMLETNGVRRWGDYILWPIR
jgi:hypothetical protein